jgi:pimeloyl-ACP methyl ester carboxylesterase
MLSKKLKWTLVGAGFLFGLIVLGGAICQAVAESEDLARFPAPGKLIDVDGHLMHIYCRGAGSPTVVVELGVGAIASSWDEIHRKMSLVTRVCLYDRAGLGYSEPVDYWPRARQIAERLDKLLRGADIDDDLILVGWSAGGVYAREFYRQRPERIRAMLLLDSSHEQQARRLPPSLRAGGNSALEFARFLAPLGLVRLSGLVETRFESFRGTDELRARLIALYEQSHVVGAMLRESQAFDLDIDGDPPTSLDDLPLIVLTEGKPIENESIPPAELEYERRSREVKTELQRELAALSTRGRQIVATQSGHGIQTDQPELVMASLMELVELVRTEAQDRAD